MSAIILRFGGVWPGYNQYHSDESVTYSAATSMIKNENLDPLRYDYPALVPLTNMIFFRSVFIPLYWTKYYTSHFSEIVDGKLHLPLDRATYKRVLNLEILGERNLNAMFWGRAVTAFFGCLGVYLIYRLGKEMFSKEVGLLAGFFLTFSYRHAMNSHLGLPDIYNSFFFVLSLYFAYLIWVKKTMKYYVFAGLAFGGYVSVKYQIFPIFAFGAVFVFNFLARKKRKYFEVFERKWWIFGLVAFLVFMLVNPYFFLYFKDVVKIVSGVSEKYGMGTKVLNLYPFWYLFNIDYGPVLFIIVLFGLIYCLVRYPKKFLLTFLPVVGFYWVMIYYSKGGFYVRNFITPTPILMLYAGVVVNDTRLILKKLTGGLVSFIGLALILIAAVWIPGRNALLNIHYYSKPWNYDQMAQYLRKNLDPGVVVAAHPFDPPGVKMKKTEFEISGSYSLAEHRENGAKYALLNLNWGRNSFYGWMGYGLRDFKLIGQKPYLKMRNSFHGLAAEEIIRKAEYKALKGWQASESDLVLTKIEPLDAVEFLEIARYSSLEMKEWENLNGVFMKTHDDGMRLEAGGSNEAARIISDSLLVKPGYRYRVVGTLKSTDELNERNRKGFLRLDFFDKSESDEYSGIASSVSSRIKSSGEWVEKVVEDDAPKEAKSMRVSFQIDPMFYDDYFISEIVIFESKSMVKEGKILDPKFELDLLYPNSHGNM